MSSKKQIAKIYAEKRRQAKEAYIKENGSARGFKKSSEYKRTFKNQRNAEYRLREKKKTEAKEREAKKKVTLNNVFVISQWEIYHFVLAYSANSPRAVIKSMFDVFAQRKDKRTYLRVTTPDNRVGLYKTMYSSDQALKALYNIGKSKQEATNDSAAMLVAAVYGENETDRFVNVYSMFVGSAVTFDLPDMPPSDLF